MSHNHTIPPRTGTLSLDCHCAPTCKRYRQRLPSWAFRMATHTPRRDLNGITALTAGQLVVNFIGAAAGG
jgi:hypothetical protein